jgi:hypothetical protein
MIDFYNGDLTVAKRLCLVLALIKTAPDDEQKAAARLRKLADELAEQLSSMELELIKATSSALIAAGFPNITQDIVSEYLDGMSN